MHSPKDCWLDHERVEVYQESMGFIAWRTALLDGTGRKGHQKRQVDLPNRHQGYRAGPEHTQNEHRLVKMPFSRAATGDF